MAFLLNGLGESEINDYRALLNWFSTGKLVREDENGGGDGTEGIPPAGGENGDAEGEPGSPILRHEKYEGELDTIGKFVKEAERILTGPDGRRTVMVAMLAAPGVRPRPLNLDSGERDGDGMVFFFSSAEVGQAVPVPLELVLRGVKHDRGDLPDSAKIEFVVDGEPVDVAAVAFDVARFRDDPAVWRFMKFELKPAADRTGRKEQKALASDGPLETAGQILGQLERMQAASGMSGFKNRPVVFRIPSVPDRVIREYPNQNEIPDETRSRFCQLCVVDSVSQFKGHVKADMMGFDRIKELGQVIGGGDFTVEKLVYSLGRVKPDLQMFFMYGGDPYELEEMKADHKGVAAVLVPWGSLDESDGEPEDGGPFREIREWAESCGEAILDWYR